MKKKVLRELPTEQSGPWPLLVVPMEERRDPIPETPKEQQRRLKRASRDLLLQDLVAAMPKGAVLGFFLFTVIYDILPTGAFWLSNWHWVIPLGGAIVLSLLVGFDLTLIVMTVVAFFLSLGAVITQSIMLLLFVGCSVLLRCIIELLPRKSSQIVSPLSKRGR